MSRQFNSFEDFLGHKPQGGSKFLTGWKENGKLFAWLHTRQFPISLWRHSFPTLIVKTDKVSKKEERHIWTPSYNCWETEDVLKEQYNRNKNTGARDKMPVACSMCRFWEMIYQLVRSAKLDPTTPIMKFEGADDPRENKLLHAAGVYNGFNYKKMTDAEKEIAKKAGVFESEAWKEDIRAKMSYVFTIVNNDAIGDGVQVTTETSSLGQRVQGAINDAIESKGIEAGDPTKHPYCLEFIYTEKAAMNEKYSARVIEKIPLTAEIERLIRSDPPDLSRMLEPFNQKEWRALLEKSLLIDVDLDWVFDVEVPSEEEGEQEHEEGEDDDGRPYEPQGDDNDANEDLAKEPEPQPAKSSGRKLKEEPKPKAIPPEELGDPCAKCDAPMRATDMKCESCGTEYEDEEEEAAPQPPPPKKTAAAAPKKTSAATSKGDAKAGSKRKVPF